jgi:hypothetical protein
MLVTGVLMVLPLVATCVRVSNVPHGLYSVECVFLYGSCEVDVAAVER